MITPETARTPHTDEDVSPYLRRPLRTLELALRETEQRLARERAWATRAIRVQQRCIAERLAK